MNISNSKYVFSLRERVVCYLIMQAAAIQSRSLRNGLNTSCVLHLNSEASGSVPPTHPNWSLLLSLLAELHALSFSHVSYDNNFCLRQQIPASVLQESTDCL